MFESVFAQKRSSKVVWQALCGSCLWIAIADFSGRLMTFVYCFVCACQTVCKISSEKPQKTYQDFQTFYCQKPCLFKVRLPHATNFQKNKLNHLSTFKESKISPKWSKRLPLSDTKHLAFISLKIYGIKVISMPQVFNLEAFGLSYSQSQRKVQIFNFRVIIGHGFSDHQSSCWQGQKPRQQKHIPKHSPVVQPFQDTPGVRALAAKLRIPELAHRDIFVAFLNSPS